MGDNTQEEINKIKLQIGLIERDIISLSKLSEKISESIEKIQELNVNFVKMISISEQRHTVHDDIEDEMKCNIKDVDGKLLKLNSEINDKLTQFESQLLSKLEDLKAEIMGAKSSASSETMADYFKTKYMVIGGAAVLGWLLAHIGDISKLIGAFK